MSTQTTSGLGAVSPRQFVSTDGEVLAIFGATFTVGIGIVLWITRLRVGVLEIEDLDIFFSLFVLQDYWPALVGLVVVALALLRPIQEVSVGLVEAIGSRPILTSIIWLAVLSCGAFYAYHAHPLSMDEYSPYFQSRVFATGHLAGRFPVELLDWLVPPGFQNVFLAVSPTTGEIASVYMPGFALLLTPFTFIGLPWLCNPVLGALSLLVLYHLAMHLFGNVRLAGLVMLTAAASSALSVNAMSYYSMTAHALANGCYALLLLRPTVARCWLAGVVGSLALVLHNPLPHTLFALPWLAWLTLRSDRLRTLPAIASGYLPLFLVLGVGWTRFIADLQTIAGPIGDAGAGVVERWLEALGDFLRVPTPDLLFVRAVGLAKLWIWSVPVLLVAAFAGTWSGWSDYRLRLLALSCLTTLVGFLFVVFSQGHGWGFRYFHSAWLCLPLLAAALVYKPASERPQASHTTFSYVAAVAVLSLATLLPLQVWQVHGFIARHLDQLPRAAEGSPRLVVIAPAMGYYAGDLVQNDPFLREPVIHMLSHGRPADAAMIRRHFPELSRLSDNYRGEVWGFGLRDKSTVRELSTRSLL